jgi:hypothetical protein
VVSTNGTFSTLALVKTVTVAKCIPALRSSPLFVQFGTVDMRSSALHLKCAVHIDFSEYFKSTEERNTTKQ